LNRIYTIIGWWVALDELRNKTSVPVFYRGNKPWVRFWMRMI